MYKKMLVPLDGSKFAASALEHAKAIAKGCNVPELFIMRVIESTHGYEGWAENWHGEAEERAKKWTKDYLTNVVEELKKDGITAMIVIADGDPAEEILGYARKNNVDLIVMSTHGSSGVARWLLGSVTDRIVRHSICPVLVISQHELEKAK